MRGGHKLAIGPAAAAVIACVTLLLLRFPPSRSPAVSPAVRLAASENLRLIPGVLEEYERKTLTTKDGPWTLFHGLLGHGADFQISYPDGAHGSCMDWLLHQASWQAEHGLPPLVLESDVGLSFLTNDIPEAANAFERHEFQFLWVLSECNLNIDELPVCVPPRGQKVPLREMLHTAENLCTQYSDVSWALPVLAMWEPRARWQNRFGTEFDFDRLLMQHLDREEQCGACFGTHWRMGLAAALKGAGGKVSKGVRTRANARLHAAIEEAHRAQNDSGQFELTWEALSQDDREWPALPCGTSDLLSHHGHMLEWLMVALPDDAFATQMWPHRATAWLIHELDNPGEEIAYGAHSHCAHALRLYSRRCSRFSISKTQVRRQ